MACYVVMEPPGRVGSGDAVLVRDRFSWLAFLVPPPPVDAREEDVWFPVVGTMEDRLLAQKSLVTALTRAVAAVPHAELIDLTDLLTGPTGGMPIEYTLDGAHTNATTVAKIRERVAEHRLTA